MIHNTKKKLIDPFHNISYGDVSDEEITHFMGGNTSMPIYVECIGISHPNPDYYIERKHGDYFVFEYVLSGVGYIVCNNVSYTVGKDDMYILPEGSQHKYWADKNDPYEKIWINIHSSIIKDILRAYGLAGKVVFKNSNCKALFYELFQLAKTTTFNDEVCYSAAEIIFKIINKVAQNENLPIHASTVAKSAKVLLDDNLYGNITVEAIAKQLAVSKVQIINEFKKYYHTTPYAYYIDHKMDIAKNMLETTSLRVSEIAEVLGFYEQNYFSYLFKKKIGVSPDKYRKNMHTPPRADNG